MDDRVRPRHQPIDQLAVADVALHELKTIRRATGQRSQVAGIGQLVQNHHRIIGGRQDPMHEVRPDKPRTTSHQKNTHDITVPKLARIGAGQASLTTSKRVKPAG